MLCAEIYLYAVRVSSTNYHRQGHYNFVIIQGVIALFSIKLGMATPQRFFIGKLRINRCNFWRSFILREYLIAAGLQV